MILVTGGAGFIGANFILQWTAQSDEPIVNLDKLSYAGNLNNLLALEGDARHHFVHGDIADRGLLSALLASHRPRAVLHFAAESHVDRSIHGPGAFIDTNVNGTFALLETVLAHWSALPSPEQAAFRFLHVSTDEVFGSLVAGEAPFTERSAYAPNSPYSASKAAADHLVRAFGRTYGLPVLTVHSANNYGPMQFPEKLIPLFIANARGGMPLPLYGDGLQVRDWLHVIDHCAALRRVLEDGRPGEAYNIGGGNEHSNLEVAEALCTVLDELAPKEEGSYRSLIAFVADRPGHDRRYAIDAGKMRRELGWSPSRTFAGGIRDTVRWYLGNTAWVETVRSGAYRHWIERQYGPRSSGAAA